MVPELVSWQWNVRDRGGQARLDYTQNAINKTLVAPYSPRPAPGAPVSAPIDWDELDDPALRSDGVTIGPCWTGWPSGRPLPHRPGHRPAPPPAALIRFALGTIPESGAIHHDRSSEPP